MKNVILNYFAKLRCYGVMKRMRLPVSLLVALLFFSSATAEVAYKYDFNDPPIKFDEQLKPQPIDKNETNLDTATAKAALCYINHLNYVVAQLGEMKDLIVLEQEYENLTDNNLNLAKIEDIETVEIIQSMMDLITEMEKNNVASIGAQLALVKAKKEAIWKALPSPGGIGGMVIGGGGTPVAIALAVTSTVWTSYQNYRNAKAEAESEYDKEVLKLATEKLEQLNELNKELFYSQWRLMKKYNLTDYSRVTRNESTLLQNWGFLSDHYAHAKSSQDSLYWEILKNNESTYSNLHQYWVARVSAATDLYNRSLKKDNSQEERQRYRDDVISSCKRYFGLLKDAPIIRKDPVANSLALLYVTMNLQAIEEERSISVADKEKLIQWLRYIEANTRIIDVGTKYALVELYKHKAINDRNNASRLAKGAFMEVQACLGLYNENKINIFCTNTSFKTAMGDWVTKGKKAMKENCKSKDKCKLSKKLKEEGEIIGNVDEKGCCEICAPMANFARYVSKWQREQEWLLPLDEWYCLFDAVVSCIKEDKGALEAFIQDYRFPLGEDDLVSCVQRYVALGSRDEKVKVQNCLKKIRTEKNLNETQAWHIKFPKKWFHNRTIEGEGNAPNGDGVIDLGALSVKNIGGKLQKVKTREEESDTIVVELSNFSQDLNESCSVGIRMTNVCQIDLLLKANDNGMQLKTVSVEMNSGFKKEIRVRGSGDELLIVE